MNRVLTILLLTFFLASCNKAPYLPYHSTAGIPHETRMVETDMTLINSADDETNNLSYAVIAALDNEELPYILIAPTNNSQTTEKKIWDYNISYSTTIHPNKVKELINSLNIVLQEWNSVNNSEDGYFYEFTNTPEHRIFQNSPNVETKIPTVMVNFNVTGEGSTGSLIIGEGELRHIYKFEEKQDVMNFRNLLNRGLDELEEMAG